MHGLLGAIRKWEGTASCFAFGDSHHAQLLSEMQAADLQAFLKEKNFEEVQIQPIQADIEDVFMNLLLEQA